jgi:hypothetical protein
LLGHEWIGVLIWCLLGLSWKKFVPHFLCDLKYLRF